MSAIRADDWDASERPSAYAAAGERLYTAQEVRELEERCEALEAMRLAAGPVAAVWQVSRRVSPADMDELARLVSSLSGEGA